MTSDLRGQLQATLGAAYTLERELGGGGMSRVFVATENRLRRRVVIKVVSSDLAAGVSADRFEREIQLAASLQQANIVPLLSAGETGGIPYYSMPFVEGESLRSRLSTSGRLGIQECVGVLRDLARALSYAHARGVVHRDIKPDNILLSHGAAMVTDFGIAKAISAARTHAPGGTLTMAGTSIGTPGYMAPEQVAGDAAADHRLDIYAFGCVAYELLTGQPPFVDTAPQKVLAAHLAQVPRPIREVRPEIPGPLATLVMRCLAKQADDRPQSADEVLQALDAIATPSGGQAIAASAPGRAWWKTPPVLAGAVVVVIVGVMLALSNAGRSASTQADTSIAVMPLVNLSGDSTNNYFGEGLAEELTGALAKAGLHVIGRGSARALAGRGLDAKAIAAQLGVGSVLQGTVQRSGDQLRISMTLTSASDGSIRWTEKYDRQLKDVFAVQDEIARSVVTELRAALAPGAGTALVRTETTDPEAHALYLRGLSLWNRRTAPAIRQAIRLFGEAVQRDPNYARAHAGTALAYTALPFYEDANTDSLVGEAQAAADRALAIDSSIVDAWSAKAFSNAYTGRPTDAVAQFARAIRTDSTSATARFWHGLFLVRTGRSAEARREIQRAGQLEPASLVIASSLTFPDMVEGNYDAAIKTTRSVLARDTTFAIAYTGLASSLSEAGRHDEAIQVARQALALPGLRPSEANGVLAYTLVRAGRAEEARRVLTEFARAAGTWRPVSGIMAAAWYELGERETALSVLKAALDQHDPWLLNYGRTPRYAKLRADPQGRTLLESADPR